MRRKPDCERPHLESSCLGEFVQSGAPALEQEHAEDPEPRSQYGARRVRSGQRFLARGRDLTSAHDFPEIFVRQFPYRLSAQIYADLR